MAELCNCDEAEDEHEHCVACDCILRWDESENYCCWCEERMKREKEENCECGFTADGTWSEELFEECGCTCE